MPGVYFRAKHLEAEGRRKAPIEGGRDHPMWTGQGPRADGPNIDTNPYDVSVPPNSKRIS